VNRVNLTFDSRHCQALQDLSRQTGDSQSAWLRQMIDYCYRPNVLNEMVPHMSGRIQIGVTK
jgi:hypothetical protein